MAEPKGPVLVMRHAAQTPQPRFPSVLRIAAVVVAISLASLIASVLASDRGGDQRWLPGGGGAHSVRQRGFGPLRFRPDGTFHISIFEDLHFGENAWDDWGPRQDLQSVKVMETVLDAEPQTDLVVLNGDLITGENTFLENSTHYIDQLVQPMLRRNLTWASTYGNHDSNLNISTTDILAREQLYPNSRTTSMVSHSDAGVSNYYLPVYPAVCRRNTPYRPLLLLWFFDSRGGFARSSSQLQQATAATPIPIPNWVSSHVAAWFRQTHARLNPNTYTPPIPSLAFFHIPTHASFTLQQAGIDPHRQPGLDDDGPLDHQAKGWCPDDDNNGTRLTQRKGCDYGGQDAPFMAALADTPGLLAVFSGHDHGETWCAPWGGGAGNDTVKTGRRSAVLCFGQHSGYGGYGSWIRGGRQISVNVEGLREGEVETWVRLESGKAVGRVRLNGTYGGDVYPETPDERTRLPPSTAGQG